MMKELLGYSLNKELETILKAGIRRTELQEDQRNGYRRRSLGTHIADRIDNFLVPRARKSVKFSIF